MVDGWSARFAARRLRRGFLRSARALAQAIRNVARADQPNRGVFDRNGQVRGIAGVHVMGR